MNKENPGECECCGFPTQDLTLYENQLTTIAGGGRGQTRRDDFWYCELCASTMASTYHRYPDQTPSGSDVLRSVCRVGNIILATLRNAEPQATVSEGVKP